jgi:Integrase core domain
MDNIFVERLWRSLKYEEVYLNAYATVAEARTGISAWLRFYNEERQHQSLGYRTPWQVYRQGLWICGRSALPTGCASPASRASSEGGEMLAFAHIPTGATANTGFNIDEVNSTYLEPAVALTAIGADIETGGGYTLRRGFGCRMFGVHLTIAIVRRAACGRKMIQLNWC